MGAATGRDGREPSVEPLPTPVSGAHGAAIQIQDCTGRSEQVWRTSDRRGTIGALVNPAGKCVDVINGDPRNNNVHVRECWRNAAQVWTAPGVGSLRAAGKCLPAHLGGTAPGTAVLLWDCGPNPGPSAVWEILNAAGVDPAPQRATVTWAVFLRSQAEVVLAMDFIETVARQYVLAAVHHAGRRVRILGTAAHPTHSWVTQAVRNLLMDSRTPAASQESGSSSVIVTASKYPALIDEILGGAGIATILTGIRVPRMNAIMERWVKTLGDELLDRTLIWNEPHLRHALKAYEQHHNHRSLAAAAPLRARLQPLGPDRTERLAVLRRDRLGGVLHEYRHAARPVQT